MQITSQPMPLPDYGKYPSSPAVTPEQVSQARNEALTKKDELQAQSEEKATARRTLAVSYTANQQEKAVVERYLEASGQESASRISATICNSSRARSPSRWVTWWAKIIARAPSSTSLPEPICSNKPGRD